MAKVDLQGNELKVGDKIVVGACNGSSLSVQMITKLGKKKVHFTDGCWNGNRDYDRVVKISKE